jgi:capsular polysaccharide biosynthesis protein
MTKIFVELKNYLKIFAKNWIWFLLTVIIILVAGAGYKQYENSRPVSYEVSLLLNVTRSGIQTTDTYRYDDFYRLQADERFADTVVTWLKNPRIVTNIYNEAGKISGGIGLSELAGAFKVKRTSSQAISVSFKAESAREAQDLSESMTKAINNEIKSLNQYQKEENWFKIVGEEPVIKEYKITWNTVLPISIMLGIFLGIWVVLIKHYLKKD